MYVPFVYIFNPRTRKKKRHRMKNDKNRRCTGCFQPQKEFGNWRRIAKKKTKSFDLCRNIQKYQWKCRFLTGLGVEWSVFRWFGSSIECHIPQMETKPDKDFSGIAGQRPNSCFIFFLSSSLFFSSFALFFIIYKKKNQVLWSGPLCTNRLDELPT